MTGVSATDIRQREIEREIADAPTMLETVFGKKMSPDEQDKLGKVLQNERGIAFWAGQRRGEHVDLTQVEQVQAMFNRVRGGKRQRADKAVRSIV